MCEGEGIGVELSLTVSNDLRRMRMSPTSLREKVVGISFSTDSVP